MKSHLTCQLVPSLSSVTIYLLNPSPYTRTVYPHSPYNPTAVRGTAVVVGSTHMEIVVPQNWGPRVVVRWDDGKEKVLWGKDLRLVDKEGKTKPHGMHDPYDALRYHAWNRKRLRKIKPGSLIERRVSARTVPGCSDDTSTKEWKRAKVLRVVRSGCYHDEEYTVTTSRLHTHALQSCNTCELSRYHTHSTDVCTREV